MTNKTFVDILEQHAIEKNDQVAISYLMNGEDISEQLTYHELTTKIKQLATNLQLYNGCGERAVLLLPNNLDFVVSVLACMYAGVIPVPAYPPASQHHLLRVRSIIKDSKPKFVLLNNQVAARLDRFSFCFDANVININIDNIVSVDDWHRPDINSDTLALLQYTSGSCDEPKGVMVSHRNLLANNEMISHATSRELSKHYLSWIPLFHDMGLIGHLLQSLYLGVDILLMSPAKFIQKPIRWLNAISKYQVTHSGAPNFAFDLCVDKSKNEDKEQLNLEHWVVAYCGAEPIRAETISRFIQAYSPYHFNPRAFHCCYGLAEATVMVSGGEVLSGATVLTVDKKQLEKNYVQLDEILEPTNLVACGKICINEEVIIVDPETCKRCNSENIGEIWIKGNNVASGYWQNENATQQTFHGYTSDTMEGPYLRSGDLGFIHEGLLYITSRLKDLIVIRGKTHHPHDIEYTAENSSAELCNPGAVAFSLNIANEEQLIIVQELNKRVNYDKQIISESMSQAILLQHGIIPYDIIFTRERGLPRTSSGKLQRYLAKQWYLSKSFPEIL